jgi:hypothetical protein
VEPSAVGRLTGADSSAQAQWEERHRSSCDQCGDDQCGGDQHAEDPLIDESSTQPDIERDEFGQGLARSKAVIQPRHPAREGIRDGTAK